MEEEGKRRGNRRGNEGVRIGHERSGGKMEGREKVQGESEELKKRKGAEEGV